MYKILIVEDDDKISSMLKEELERYNYKVIGIDDYEKVLDIFIKEDPHIVLLDINLPKYDGFYWCREIRKISNVPIIYISARFSDMDQVLAIERGGDDYIIKPFSFDIVNAKIKSLLRRTYGEYQNNQGLNILDVDGLILDKNKHFLKYNDKKVELTNKELNLLNLLMTNINNVVSREDLLEELWDDISFVDDNTLSVNITRVRKQLDKLGIRGSIKTKRGQGYMMKNNWGDSR